MLFASSYLLVPKYGRKFGAIREGEKAPLGGPYLPVGSVFVLPHDVWWRGPMWDKGKDAKGITVDRVSASCSTSSQMCGIWYLPRFMFRKGLLINMASFMILVTPGTPCPSIMEKLSSWFR